MPSISKLSAIVAVVLCGKFALAADPRENPAAYVWKDAEIHGGGFVAGIIPHPTVPGLMYARTDLGGAYRWDAREKCWIPITDWIGRADSGLMGCESIAVDPADAGRVYLALGMYTNLWGQHGAIARSPDQGRTFVKTDLPIKLGGNCPGRSAGERLAVDPNDGRVLFFGSRADGLWKSADQAVTWNKVESFPAVAMSPAACDPQDKQWALGISFVKFDATSGKKGSPTPVMYAGVLTQQPSIFRSTDGGSTWVAVPGQPVGFRPNHMVMSPAGIIDISYGDQAGPNGMEDGALWQLNSKTGQWTDITPVKPSKDDRFGYGAVTMDARHPDTLMATSMDRWGRGDTVFRTTDGGKSWTSQTVGGGHFDRSHFDATDAPWALTMKPHWTGDIEIDPFDSDHAIFVTGYGLWATRDATALNTGQPVHWKFEDKGLEETVPLELISPTAGPHLISVIGDFDGFTHDNLDASARRFSPGVGTSSGLDFAGKMPSRVVRAGGKAEGFYSDDGGESWTAFPAHPNGGKDGGEIAISSDGKTILWQPNGAVTSRSTDLGKSWTACKGLPHPLHPVADRVAPDCFYAFDGEAGQMFVSRDGGANFAAGAKGLPHGRGSLRAVFDHPHDIWLAVGSRLWHSADAGASFVKLTSVDKTEQVGFGKAAPGRSYPAIYICGEANGVDGLFRSDDAGQSWARIDDDQHRFGWLNVVIGDPRVYGRVYVGTSGRGIVYGDLEKTRQ
jgi:photosystem II stability/assembly factor-like uncharacterized protein